MYNIGFEFWVFVSFGNETELLQFIKRFCYIEFSLTDVLLCYFIYLQVDQIEISFFLLNKVSCQSHNFIDFYIVFVSLKSKNEAYNLINITYKKRRPVIQSIGNYDPKCVFLYMCMCVCFGHGKLTFT